MGPFLCNHTCWEFRSARKTQHPSCSSLAVSCPPLSMVPEPCKGDTEVPLPAGYSTVTYSDHLWTSALTSTKHKFLWPKLTVALNYKHKRNIKTMVGQETASCPFSKTAVAYLLWPRSSPATDLWPAYSTRQWSVLTTGREWLVPSVTLVLLFTSEDIAPGKKPKVCIV